MDRNHPHLKTKLSQRISAEIRSISTCAGGCTAQSYKIETDSEILFLKTIEQSTDVFRKEANGLQALGESGELRLPEVKFFDDEFLCLKWIENSKPSSQCYERFGKSLARHHGFQGKKIGFFEDNYIGRTIQVNSTKDSWNDFFIEHRLKYQYDLLLKRGLSNSFIDKNFDLVLKISKDALAVDEAVCSPLHGDLWGGNHLMDQEGEMVLIDPAFYYGHREADLGLMKLFGSYPDIVFEAYQNEWPLLPGHELRLVIYQLYHGLNHVNLEGTCYMGLVEEAIKKIIES